MGKDSNFLEPREKAARVIEKKLRSLRLTFVAHYHVLRQYEHGLSTRTSGSVMPRS